MYSEMGHKKGSKLQSSTSNLATYQGQPIRGSIGGESKKTNGNRRVLTENSQKCFSVSQQMRKVIKQFHIPFKSTSPNLKKQNLQHVSSHQKLTFVNKTEKKKKQKTTTGKNINSKTVTETGPVIHKKKTINDRQKPKIDKNCFKNDKKSKIEDKKGNAPLKKLAHYKSTQKLKEEKSALKMQPTTFDTTPHSFQLSGLEFLGVVGQGTFGKVYKVRVKKNGNIVAVKKVFQDPKYKNRETQIVSMLDSDFTMKVLGTFTTSEDGSQYLNIVMDFYDGDLYSSIKESKKGMSAFDIKLATYQIFRGLLYVHSKNIAHRDIKPHNILFKGRKHVICDFGSAKVLTSEPNLPYICSRCYRAPELIFGATHYTTMIDIWSVGCVVLEMINGIPLFIAETSVDHLIEIIKVMGTPTKTQVIEMNPDYDLDNYKLPKVKKKSWKQVFPKADELLLDLLEQMMIYAPKQRLNAAEALCHEFFDELREEKVAKYLQKHYDINLFNFSSGQLKDFEHLLPQLIPEWASVSI